MPKVNAKATEFLKTAHLYHLGELVTEARHPLTMNLSELANNDLPKAFNTLSQVDVEALKILQTKTSDILRLRAEIKKTLADKGKIYLCGCGATGRLSLLLERLWRELVPGDESVRAFMAGGDVALVHSLEGFEDYPEYGARHLMELGFTDQDLLIASTEGGETPYVIGATEKATQISRRKPFFLYCNPDAVLKNKVERSKRVIESDKIEKINLNVGPMALSGSTRMQASTVLQLTIGYALLTSFSEAEIKASLTKIADLINDTAPLLLKPFTERESQVYSEGAFIMYVVKDYPITVFTDTTERAPTFSLTSFSHKNAGALLKKPPSLSYMSIAGCQDGAAAWMALLGRKARALNWLDIDERTSDSYLNDFDFSVKAREFRKTLLNDKEQFDFNVFRSSDGIEFSLMEISKSLLLDGGWHPLEEHTILKLLLNQHSTLVMGRLGRYKNNVMTWVQPTNGKLIDRATRYVRMLLLDSGLSPSYEDVVHTLFNELETIKSNESVVLKTYEAFCK